MGLAVETGVLAYLISEDPEGADWIRGDLQAINAVLQDRGFPTHDEPEEVTEEWGADGYGYGGLHALRSVAGHIAQGTPIPRDRVLETSDGSELKLYDLYEAALKTAHPENAMPRFAHLVQHPDSQGYYLPVDFPIPVRPAEIDEDTEHLWPVGSVPRLASELAEIAVALQIPDDLSSDDDVLSELLEDLGALAEGPLWQSQPIAAYMLLILREGCASSLRTGSALAFT